MIIKLNQNLPKVSGLLAGTDEAGRGPLAGDVFAAAVILNPNKPIVGLDDSKKLTEKKRLQLATQIKQCALAWSVQQVSVAQIDEMNILQASLFAMVLALDNLSVKPQHVFVDGNQMLKNFNGACDAIIKGDSRVAEISAASILAKVTRDAYMLGLDKKYPQYGFAKHKGYATKIHIAALKKYGATVEHRRSFAPVRAVLGRHTS